MVEISQRFCSLSPYSFRGTILKLEDVNYEENDPRKPFRDLYGYAISAKRYCLFEGKNARKIVDAKAHGIGYLASPVKRDKDADRFAEEFWKEVLYKEGIRLKSEKPEWLDRPAIMKIPVSSPAVLGRLKGFVKPYDFVNAPVVRDGDLNLDEQADKPILITRFTKNSREWADATYYNVRTGEPCRITTGESRVKSVISVRSYRSVLSTYVNNAESKFNGPDGRQCWVWTRGILQRMHVVADAHRYCGKEFKRKLEQGPLDHETEFKCKVYSGGKVEINDAMRSSLSEFTERRIQEKTGLRRDSIRNARKGERVTQKVYRKLSVFLIEE